MLFFNARGNHVFGSPSVTPAPMALQAVHMSRRPRRASTRSSQGTILEARLRDSRSPPRTKQCCATRAHRQATLSAVARCACLDISALSVFALAANASVDGRRTHAELTCETRDVSMPSMKLSTGVIPRDRERDLSGDIQMARPSASRGRMGRGNPTALGRARVSALESSHGPHRARPPGGLRDPVACRVSVETRWSLGATSILSVFACQSTF